MLGGFFEYQQYRLNDMADQIQNIHDTNDEDMIEDRYSVETRIEFRKAIIALQIARIYVDRIDWLLSGDDSEETFHKRLKKDLENL